MDPTLERTFKGHRNYVTSVSFSNSQRQLASGSGDNSVMLWNFRPQLRAFRYLAHKEIVTDVQFSPEGDILASASKDRTVRLWVPSAHAKSVELRAHTGPVRSVAFAPDSSSLITASDDKTVKVWNLPSRRFACSLQGHSNWVRKAVFSPCNAALAASGSDDRLVKLWDVPSHQCIHTFYDHTESVNTVQFYVDGNCICSGSSDSTIKMWDVRSHQLVQHYSAHSDEVTSVSIHPSGYYLASSSKDATIKLWDLREGRLLYTLKGHAGATNGLCFSKDGHFLASGGADQLVMVWKSGLHWEAAPQPDPEHDWTAPVVDKRAKIDTTDKRAGGSPEAPPKFRVRTAAQPTQAGAGLEGGAARPPRTVSPYQLKGGSEAKARLLQPTASALAAKADKQRKAPLRRLDALSATLPQPPAMAYTGPSIDLKDIHADGDIPKSLSKTLDHIVGQLDIVTRTMSIMEQRLTLTEDRLSAVITHIRGQGAPAPARSPSPPTRQSRSDLASKSASFYQQGGIDNFRGSVRQSGDTALSSSDVPTIHNLISFRAADPTSAPQMEESGEGEGEGKGSGDGGAEDDDLDDDDEDEDVDIEEPPIEENDGTVS